MKSQKAYKISDSQLYEVGFTHSRDIILFMRREDGAILKANAAAMNAYGYTLQEMLTLTIYDLRTPETRGLIADQLARADAEGILLESVHRRKDGGTFPVEVSSRGVTIDSDRILISVVRDITERKQSEQALCQSDERLRLALLGSPVVVWEQDQDLRFTWIHNPPAGWELNVIQGKTDRELLPPEISAISEEIKRRVIRTGEPTRQEIEVRKEGRFIWWDFYVEPVRNEKGQITGIRCAATDLTQRKIWEESLRESERHLRAIYESTEEAIITLDGEQRCLEANPAAGTIAGIPHEQLIGRHLREFLDPDYNLSEAWFAFLQKGRFKGEVRIRQFDGTLRNVEATGIADIMPGRYMFVGHDITERKLGEEALRRAKDELELRVRERTAELERSNQELQEFAFVASHDLSEPLRKVQTFGRLLKARSAERFDEQDKDYISRMTGAAERMQNLLDALLRYSGIQTRGQEFEAVKLDDIVQDATNDLEVMISKAGAHIEITSLPEVNGDRDQLRQVFQNLIANAVKFRRQGVDPLVKIYATRNRKFHRVMVEDNGIGFDEKYLDKIFQPFQRLHGRSEYEGIGMGLAICKKIVERHRGAITAKSTPESGSTFIVILPKKSVGPDRPGSD